MNRFFVDPETLRGEDVELDKPLSHRLLHVLRLRAGDRIVLLDGRGGEYEAVLDEVSGSLIRARVLSRREGLPEPATRVVLCQSIVKGDRFDWVLEKGTEIGVAKFIPLVSERGVVRPRAGRVERIERWQRIVREAAEQCGRSRMPEVTIPVSFDEAVQTAKGLRLLPWEGERNTTLRQAMREIAGRAQDRVTVSLFIGPEGGFAADEVERAVDNGAQTVSLGPRILRSETAGIVAAAAVLYELGELGSRA